MKTYRWAKLWIDILDDWKVATLPDSSYRRFIECVMLAKEYNQGGVLPPMREMAFRLRLDTETLGSDMMRLAQNELAELTTFDGEQRWWLPNFEKRQETAQTSAERVRAYRARVDASLLDGNDSVTPRYTEVEVEVEEEAEVEVEKKQKQKKSGASAIAAAAAATYLKTFGIAYNDRTAPIADLDEDYIQAHLDYARKRGEKTGLAIHRMLSGDAAPGLRSSAIPDEYADIIKR